MLIEQPQGHLAQPIQDYHSAPQTVNAGPYIPQPQPSVQPMPSPDNFSSEPAMQTNAGDEKLTQVTVMLDNESLRILQEASAVHSESIVNLGIKLFSKTNVYKEFMMKPGTKLLDTKTEDLQTLSEAVADVGSVSSSPATTTVTTTAQAATISSGGFQTW